jgi:hypothetical protein
MYTQSQINPLVFKSSIVHFGKKLDENNRWILLAQRIPWKRLLYLYKKNSLFYPDLLLPDQEIKLVIGAVIVKCKEGFSSEKTVEFINENPYVQYFLGFREFDPDPITDKTTLISLLDRISVLLQKRADEKNKTKASTSKNDGFCSPQILNKIAFHNLNGFVLIEPQDIIYIKAEGNYSIFFLGNEQKEMVTLNLGRIYPKLDKNTFIRTKRSCIINSTYLSKINISKKVCVLTKNGEEFCCSISREQIVEFSKRMKEQRILSA